jgi:hypothetical protein
MDGGIDTIVIDITVLTKYVHVDEMNDREQDENTFAVVRSVVALGKTHHRAQTRSVTNM